MGQSWALRQASRKPMVNPLFPTLLGVKLPTRGALPVWPLPAVAVSGVVQRAPPVEVPQVNGALDKPMNQVDGEVLLVPLLVGVVRHGKRMVGIRSGYEKGLLI